MSAARPPGWYDEPSGDRALLRWWDGRSWTSVTRRRAPFEPPPPAPPVDPVPVPAGDVLDSVTRPDRPGSGRGWVLLVVVVGLLGLLLFTALPDRGGPGGLARSSPPPTQPTDPGGGLVIPSDPPPPSPRPVTGRVADPAARLSYDVLPGEWREWDRDGFRGLLSTAGYYRITQDSAPNGQTYWANVNSGRVGPATASRDDLRATTMRLVDTLARSYYPLHTRQQVRQQTLTVDGAQAYLVRYRAVFDPSAAEGYAAKSEEVAVLVVDTGDALPSVLYVSLPDTVRTLWPAVDGLLASVRILR